MAYEKGRKTKLMCIFYIFICLTSKRVSQCKEKQRTKCETRSLQQGLVTVWSRYLSCPQRRHVAKRGFSRSYVLVNKNTPIAEYRRFAEGDICDD
jgi:hypothetical protein